MRTRAALAMAMICALGAVVAGLALLLLGPLGGLLFVIAFFAWLLVPRRYTSSGIELFEREQPRLFEELRWIASRVGAPMPWRVFAAWCLDATTMHEGGDLTVGLPLLTIFTVAEVRSALACALARVHPGAVPLGAFLRLATRLLGSVWGRLQNARPAWPLYRAFGWFLRHFLDVTRPIHRAQHVAADRIAVRATGRASTASWLRTSLARCIDVSEYRDRHLAQLAAFDVVPPACTELARYIAATPPSEPLPGTDPFRLRDMFLAMTGSCPPIAERIATVESEPEVVVDGGGEPASTLVDGLDQLAHTCLEGARSDRA